MTKTQNKTSSNVDKDVEQQDLSFIANGNAKWYSFFATQSPGFLYNQTHSHDTSQQFYSLIFSQNIENNRRKVERVKSRKKYKGPMANTMGERTECGRWG